MIDTESSSSFVVPMEFSLEWQNITVLQRRSNVVIYTATRYGRRFLLKGLQSHSAQMTDFCLQQQKEFQIGISLTHPNIATTYALEEVPGVGTCIIQEFIDGVTLKEWLRTKPDKSMRQHVLEQLLDVLAYIHGLQMVHHDLKGSNILITRYGSNVKLIDFGLSDTDDSLSPISNDPKMDIEAFGRLLLLISPNNYHTIAKRCISGEYATISDVQRSFLRRKKIWHLFPIVFSTILLFFSLIAFCGAWYTHNKEKNRVKEMYQQVETCLASEELKMNDIFERHNSYDLDAMKDFTACVQDSWIVRDSLMNLYEENDPLRDQLWSLWTDRYTKIYNEIILKFNSKNEKP